MPENCSTVQGKGTDYENCGEGGRESFDFEPQLKQSGDGIMLSEDPEWIEKGGKISKSGQGIREIEAFLPKRLRARWNRLSSGRKRKGFCEKGG